MTQTMQLLPGVTLRACRDTRFKQGCITFQMVRLMDNSENHLNALLPAVMLRATRQHPDLRSITQHLDTLYGAALGPLVRRFGDYQTVGFYCSFLEDRFALPGDQVLKGVLEFLEEVLLESPLEEGGFLPELVESEKKNLIATLDAEMNNKQAYAMSQMLRSMCREDRFGLPRLGNQEQVASVEPVQLYTHYRRILRESPIEILYVGSREMDQVAGQLMPLLDKLERDYVNLPAQTGYHYVPGEDLVEKLGVTQGKLVMGFWSPVGYNHPDSSAMQMMNVIYGSGMSSKLFMNVREKLSLCYNVGSSYSASKGIIAVYAGIDFDKEQQTREEILRQLDCIRRGEITDAEMTSAREAIRSSLYAVTDTPGGIEGSTISAALLNYNGDRAARLAELEAVTKEQIARVARDLQLHTTYFLKGEN